MAEETEIAWTDSSFNPWWGCTKVGPGCDNCYANALDKRTGGDHWGAHTTPRTMSDENWKKPLRWNKKAFFQCDDCGWRGENPVMSSHLACGLTDGMPSCPHCDSMAISDAKRRVFCASMCDVFDNNAPAGQRERLWELIRQTPNLQWQLLTKRVGNIRKYLPADWGNGYSNVWLGITVVNQEEADRDIPKLLKIPARVRFLSMEPLLERVDLYDVHWPEYHANFPENDDISDARSVLHLVEGTRIHWVIVGGESGPGARPFALGWAKDIVRQCRAAKTPVFIKQLGANPTNREGEPCSHIKDRKGGDINEWPEILRVREFPL